MAELLWKKGRVLGHGGFGVVSLASTSNAQCDGVTLPSLIAIKSCMHTASQSLQEEGEFKDSPYVVRCFGANLSFEDGVILWKPCRLSSELQFKGTERYMAPESVQVDIWALGCTVYELLTGTPLWESDSGSEEDPEDNVLYKIGFEEPKFQNTKLSNEAIDFLKRCLVKNPSSRWTADMLLNHPFLLNSSKVVDNAKTRKKKNGYLSVLRR